MNAQGLASVPRKERPELDDLEGYEPRYEPDLDYTMYRKELGMWLADYHRDQETKRLEGSTPLMGHGADTYEQRNGYNSEDFLRKAAGAVKARPLH